MRVGNKVTATRDYPCKLTKGNTYTITSIRNGWNRVVCDNGSEDGFTADSFQPLPAGPVVTETVTKTRIVPGVYDGVTVDGIGENEDGVACVDLTCELVGLYTPDQLDAAAAVLSALVKGLRDA